MKISALVLALLLMVAPCFAATPVIATDTQGNVPTTVAETADAAVKATVGRVHSILLTYIGVTAGDKITLADSAAAGGTAIVTISAPAANGSFFYKPTAPIEFSTTGIYYDETKSGGNFYATIQYS